MWCIAYYTSIKSTEDGFTICLFIPNGTGNPTVREKWRNFTRNDRFSCIGTSPSEKWRNLARDKISREMTRIFTRNGTFSRGVARYFPRNVLDLCPSQKQKQILQINTNISVSHIYVCTYIHKCHSYNICTYTCLCIGQHGVRLTLQST